MPSWFSVTNASLRLAVARFARILIQMGADYDRGAYTILSSVMTCPALASKHSSPNDLLLTRLTAEAADQDKGPSDIAVFDNTIV